jgi:trehalose 6-phosphate phosphatase
VIAPWQAVVEGLLSAYETGGHLILLFDYDGTLVPIAEHPRLARLSPAARRLLERLSRRPRVCVGVLSGRRLDELRESLCLPRVCLAGTSGLELDLYGLRVVHPRARHTRNFIEEVSLAVSASAADYPGAWVEKKGLGFTVHFRHTPLPMIGGLRKSLQKTLEPFSPRLRCSDGPMALEVTSELGWNKGTAVSMIVDHVDPARCLPLFAGDSANDADAMEATTALGGIAIGIGPEAPLAADYRLANPAALHELLQDLDRRMDVKPKRSTADSTLAQRRTG